MKTKALFVNLKKKKKTNQGEESNKNLKEPLVFQWD